jgi:glycosyltransferase involved in cell wall biosynthesis
MAPHSPRPGGPEPLAVPRQDAEPEGVPGRADPVISVVIPHLAQPELLRRCLRSLAAQEGAPPFEVLVVDNGSAELPAEICAAFGARLLAEPVPGPGPARNRGADAARGAILAFTDADCVIDPGWLAAIARRFGQDPQVGILGGDVRIALADPDRITAVEAYESIYAFRTRLYIERDRYVATLNMAVRRTVFEQVGPFGGIEIAEDIDWGQRATALGLPMVYEPAARVQHPARPDFAALCRKWDRHLAHFYDEARRRPLWWPRWIAKAGAVALSPVGETLTVLRSDRIEGGRARRLALEGLIRIRLYRAGRMLSLGLGADPARLSGAWNRS